MIRIRRIVLLAAVFTPLQAFAQTPETVVQPTFEIVQAGDNQMACPALIEEINALNGELQRVQTGLYELNAGIGQDALASAQASMASSAARSVGGLAAGLIPGAAAAMGAAQLLADTGQRAQLQAQRARTMAQIEAASAQTMEAANRMVPLEQRIDHLSAISRAKAC